MTQKEMDFYDNLVDFGIATKEELNLARNLVCGEWSDVLVQVLYIRTGYRNWEQFMECEYQEFADDNTDIDLDEAVED